VIRDTLRITLELILNSAGTSASCPCAAGYQCNELRPCVWGCQASTKTSTHTATNTHTVVPEPPSSLHPPFAGSDPNRFLPCTPGTFICIDKETWDTCDYNAAGHWVYKSPRTVAAGTQCLPFLSPNLGAHKQQASTRSGFHRDDRIVRARPDGDCATDGALKCTDGGAMFEICDHGGWVAMGAVAAGTKCADGHIVSA